MRTKPNFGKHYAARVCPFRPGHFEINGIAIKG